jgi:hypothetical protein
MFGKIKSISGIPRKKQDSETVFRIWKICIQNVGRPDRCFRDIFIENENFDEIANL